MACVRKSHSYAELLSLILARLVPSLGLYMPPLYHLGYSAYMRKMVHKDESYIEIHRCIKCNMLHPSSITQKYIHALDTERSTCSAAATAHAASCIQGLLTLLDCHKKPRCDYNV